jgi:hypothetical protein
MDCLVQTVTNYTIGLRIPRRNERRHVDAREELRMRASTFIDKNVLQSEAKPEGFSEHKISSVAGGIVL